MVLFDGSCLRALLRHTNHRDGLHRPGGVLISNGTTGAGPSLLPIVLPQLPRRSYEYLADQVRDNDPALESLRLDHPMERYVRRDPSELIEALWHNTVIRQVSIGPELIRSGESYRLGMVVEQLARLENLAVVNICVETHGEGVHHKLHASFLASLLRLAPSLTTLQVGECDVVFRNVDEVEELCCELARHPRLENIALSRLDPFLLCRKDDLVQTMESVELGMGLESVEVGVDFDPLVQAMARIPHLKSVELGMARVPTTSRGSTTAMSPYAIASLAIHPQLHKLVLLPSLNLSEHEIVALFQRMIMLHVEENSRAPPDRGLQHLQIGGNLAVGGATDACWRALLRLLEQGSAPCLWKVDMPPPTSMDEEEENRILQEIDDYLFLHRPSSQRVLHADDSEFPERLASFVAKDDSQDMEDSYRLMREGSNRLEALAPQAATE